MITGQWPVVHRVDHACASHTFVRILELQLPYSTQLAKLPALYLIDSFKAVQSCNFDKNSISDSTMPLAVPPEDDYGNALNSLKRRRPLSFNHFEKSPAVESGCLRGLAARASIRLFRER